MAADPLGRGLDDDVGAVLDRSDKVSSGSDCDYSSGNVAERKRSKWDEQVLSTIRGMPCLCASSANFGMSGTLNAGFPVG